MVARLVPRSARASGLFLVSSRRSFKGHPLRSASSKGCTTKRIDFRHPSNFLLRWGIQSHRRFLRASIKAGTHSERTGSTNTPFFANPITGRLSRDQQTDLARSQIGHSFQSTVWWISNYDPFVGQGNIGRHKRYRHAERAFQYHRDRLKRCRRLYYRARFEHCTNAEFQLTLFVCIRLCVGL